MKTLLLMTQMNILDNLIYVNIEMSDIFVHFSKTYNLCIETFEQFVQ